MADTLEKHRTLRNPVDLPSPNGHAENIALEDLTLDSAQLVPQICQPVLSPLTTSNPAFPSTSRKSPATFTTSLTTASGIMELISAVVRLIVLPLLFVALRKCRLEGMQPLIRRSCRLSGYGLDQP